MTAILRAEAMYQSYPGVKVLKDVSLSVEAGETFAIIGPNGAGKSTLFKALTGEVFLDAGRILYGDRDVTRMDAAARVRLGFGRSFQVARIFQDMTTLENMIVAVEARRRNAGEPTTGRLGWRPGTETVAEALSGLDEVGLSRQRDEDASSLAHGDKKRLELAMVLALRPRILMLDEPTAGMSPNDRQAAVRLLQQVKQRHGVTLMMTEHEMDVVFNLATHLAVLHYGEIIASGAPEEVREDPMVREVYLGGAHGHD